MMMPISEDWTDDTAAPSKVEMHTDYMKPLTAPQSYGRPRTQRHYRVTPVVEHL
jgi:hypothetical protein